MVIPAAYVPSSNTSHVPFRGTRSILLNKVSRDRSSHLQVIVGKLTRKGLVGGLVHLLLVLLEKSGVDGSGGGSKGRGSNKLLGYGLAI
jgi:hypothetical protein